MESGAARRIKLVREDKGWSQAALAREAGINQSSMSRIENGKEPPYPIRGQRIADVLGWEGDYRELFLEVELKEVEER
ncbi:MAG: helix-turn-helix domain-containing protein [Coriobacteriales bacterium]|nr:helix-turn-helix domain-containing protein [Coriobacteriales bacterium]